MSRPNVSKHLVDDHVLSGSFRSLCVLPKSEALCSVCWKTSCLETTNRCSRRLLFDGSSIKCSTSSGMEFLRWPYFIHSCVLPRPTQISYYSICYLAFSFALLLTSTFLAAKALKKRRFYPLQLYWGRHVLETKMNDPEMTTAASSSTSVRSGRFSSRAGSIAARRSVLPSACNSPMVGRKTSQKSLPLEGALNTLLEIITRQNERAQAQQTGSGSSQEAQLQASQSASVVLRSPQHGTPKGPFVISYRVPDINYKRKKIFESPRWLPLSKTPKEQRSLSRLLMRRCCVSLICCLPLYVTAALQMAAVQYPQELNVLIQWLVFIQSSLSNAPFMWRELQANLVPDSVVCFQDMHPIKWNPWRSGKVTWCGVSNRGDTTGSTEGNVPSWRVATLKERGNILWNKDITKI